MSAVSGLARQHPHAVQVSDRIKISPNRKDHTPVERSGIDLRHGMLQRSNIALHGLVIECGPQVLCQFRRFGVQPGLKIQEMDAPLPLSLQVERGRQIGADQILDRWRFAVAFFKVREQGKPVVHKLLAATKKHRAVEPLF